MRRADFWTLYCPEFPLRKAPRITVRGHSVQNDSVPLRKAPLRSRIVPWSTRRPCGTLAFRRATEGSRVPRKGWGVKRGKGTIRCPCPLLPLAVGTAYPAGEHRHLRRQTAAMPSLPIGSQSRLHRLRRCIGGRFHDCKSYNYTKSIENDRLRAGDGRLVFYDRRFLKSS